MTGYVWLDWAILAVSLFNTLVPLWLGLTVLLNADRRHYGVWLMGGGLLTGAAFFVSHTAILGQELSLNTDGLNFWWRVGWIPVTIAPFAWYVVILWYGGFWAQPRPALFWRHVPWLVALSAGAAGLVGLMIVATPIPAYEQMIQLDLSGTLTIGGVPVLLMVFPAFMVVCIGLSIDALVRPAPTNRPMSEQARHRSRPWLLGAAGVLLAVSLLVAYFVSAVIANVVQGTPPSISVQMIAGFDLVLSFLIAIATILLGQAIVSYEVFTGKTLPRRGFFRHWRNILIIAGGYAVVIGGSLAGNLRPIYSLLLTALLMGVFYALYSWRSFVERDQFMARLRPFVSSPRLMTHLIRDEDDTTRANELFQAVCRDVLGAEQVQLTPLGILAPLVGTALVYPASLPAVRPPAQWQNETTALDPAKYKGYQWGIPLWAERGLIGALLVGEKRDGGVYTQEEIELAQASGERIVDMLASEQMARRLMMLQRQRTAEHRVMDLQTRRVLHDEILPALHTAALRLSGAAQRDDGVKETLDMLTETHQQISDLIRTIQPAQTRGTGDLIMALRAMVAAEFAQAFDSVEWHSPEAVAVESLVAEVVQGAAHEAVRNAALHGRGDQPDKPLHLMIEICPAEVLTIVVRDDGVGLDYEARQKGIGSGSGLALHSTLLAIVGGTLAVEARAEGGTEVRISVVRNVVS